MPATRPVPASSVAFETTFLFALRAAFFLLCKHYVTISLFSDLRSVIHEDAQSSEVDSPDIVDDVEQSGPPPATAGGGGGNYFAGRDSKTGANGGGGGAISLPLLSPKSRAAARSDLPSSVSINIGPIPSGSINVIDPPSSPSLARRGSTATGNNTRQQNVLYPKLSTSLFCLSFSESSMLFTLVLFGDVVSERARSLNWSISLLALLSLIIFIIPLGLCLLLTHRGRTTPATRTLVLTLIPFTLYLFLFYRLGSYIASKIVVEGSHSIGLINALLSRVCAPGVMMIASLSGGGAVSTAWEAFEWRVISSADPVTDLEILSAERSLYRARMDIHQRTLSLAHATASASREAEENSEQSYYSRWTSSTPAKAHLESLRIELSALENLEGQMVNEVATLKRRKELRELGRSFKGRLWLAAGWALSVYCVWRVFISCVNLIFGYSQHHHHRPTSTPVDGSGDPILSEERPPPGTDLITSLLGRLALLLNIDIDIASWSRLIGLVLIGSIILANMRNVLGSVSRVFKATSTGVSASFMLLFLAQLMSMYLLTSLISLPSSPSESSESLLDTLPDFNVFSRLFDTVFLMSAGGVFAVRWIQRKLRVGEDLL